MFKIIYTVKVKDNLEEIHNYISSDNEYYAFKVIKSILEVIDLLETFPKLGRKIDEIHYMIVDKNYGYKIIYKIDGKYIYIMGVFKYKNNW